MERLTECSNGSQPDRPSGADAQRGQGTCARQRTHPTNDARADVTRNTRVRMKCSAWETVRWRGFPDVVGEEIPLPMRLLHVARDASLFLTASGPEEACAAIERRSGAAYEPALAELAVRNFPDTFGKVPCHLCGR